MKRFFDILVSTLFLVLLSPLYLLLAFFGLLLQGRPVLFTQERPGKKAESSVFGSSGLCKQERGVTFSVLPLGAIFASHYSRRTTTTLECTAWRDEPRWTTPAFGGVSPLYTPHQFRRHEVSPGMTGWAQVKGRNSLTWEERFELDVWYVENQSFILDLKIILLTFVAVLLRKGVNQSGSKTMEKFQGSVD